MRRSFLFLAPLPLVLAAAALAATDELERAATQAWDAFNAGDEATADRIVRDALSRREAGQEGHERAVSRLYQVQAALAWSEAAGRSDKSKAEGLARKACEAHPHLAVRDLMPGMNADLLSVLVTQCQSQVSGCRDEKLTDYPYALKCIPAGTFEMGCMEGDMYCGADEKPRHKVTFSEPFALGVTEVTQGLYQAITGRNPSEHTTCEAGCDPRTLPVDSVSWDDAVAFCNLLSDRTGRTRAYTIQGTSVVWDRAATGYRLPTEAEWEYGARAGEALIYAGSNEAEDVAWYNAGKLEASHPVGKKQPNAFGLYDMSGNVWEWVWDWKASYPQGAVTDPVGPTTGETRVFRGGSWNGGPRYIRVSYRSNVEPKKRSETYGFRLAR